MQSTRMAGLVACLVLAGCGGDPRTATGAATADTADAALPSVATPGVVRGPDLDTLSPDALRERAVAAMAAQRLYAPAGDNAMEAYLALRDQRPGDGAVSMALAELQPYALIATEQALARRDTDEAARLLALMQRVDARAPALPRLRVALEDTRRMVAQAASLAAREQAQAESAARAARTMATVPVTPVQTQTQTRTAVVVSPAAAPAPQRPTVQVAAALPPAPATASTAPVASAVAAVPAGDAGTRRAPRLTRDAAPQYPRTALARGIEGEVDLTFAVEADGSVSDVRILGARPSSIFNDAARNAALRWRFEATGERHATSRTLRFRLPRSS